MTSLPAFLQNYRRGGASEALDSLTRMSTGSVPYISIQGNRFRALDAVGEEQMVGDIDRKTGLAYVDLVIVDANPNVSKVYYDKPFDPSAGEYVAPTCWSDNGVAPSAQASQPQSRSCAECPLNVWGSDMSKVSGKQTKACNDAKKIAVYVPELPGVAFLFRVPPASLKQLGNYARTLAGNGATPAQVVTRVSFSPEGIGLLEFKAVNWIDEAIMHAVDALDEGKIDLLTGKNDKPRTAVLPAPGEQKALPTNGQAASAPPPKPVGTGPFSGQQPIQMERAKSQDELIAEAVAAALAKQAAETATQAASTRAEPPADDVKKGRTRRTKAQIEADNAAKASQDNGGGLFATERAEASTPKGEDFEVPAFLNGGQKGAVAHVEPKMVAGMQAPDAPSADLQAALDAAFSLDLQ